MLTALSVVSMVGFGALGWWLAKKRGRAAPGWAAAGVIFPPLLLVLVIMGAAKGETAAEDANATGEP